MTIELRQSNYRSLIPFHVLLDLDLSANALRMYGLIEQMESCRDKVYFTISYLAKQLGLETRQTQYVAKQLKDKGYIEHYQNETGSWLWKTKKNPPEEKPEGGCSPIAGGGAVQLQGGVQSECAHNIHKSNNQKETSTSDFVISENVDRMLLRFNLDYKMYAKDDHEFLIWCKYCLDNLIKKNHDMQAKLKILKSWIKKGGLKNPIRAVKANQNDSALHLGTAYTFVTREIENRSQSEIQRSKNIASSAIKSLIDNLPIFASNKFCEQGS